jgi:hypothetical protein
MTIRTFKAVLAGSAMLALGLSANVAQAATANAIAKAQIVKALTISKTFDLNFGTVITGATGSTVEVKTDNTLVCGSGLTCAGAFNSAQFALAGSNNVVVAVSTTNASLTGPGAAMSAVLAPATPTVTLSATGAADIKVAGILSVNGAQVEGAYTGSFTVTANYQ